LLLWGLVLIGTASCAAAVRWEKTGATAAELRQDEQECASRATPESSIPTAGTIASPPVDTQVASVRPYDTTLFEECMQARGYQRTLPRSPA
jgi:hypothetical protein